MMRSGRAGSGTDAEPALELSLVMRKQYAKPIISKCGEETSHVRYSELQSIRKGPAGA
jgi:hypothetical protein